MTFDIDGERLRIEGAPAVEFRYPIWDVKEVDGILVALLRVPATESMTENVFGVSQAGVILWQIERIPETGTDPVNYYTGLRPVPGGKVTLGNWNGLAVAVDVRTGKVLTKWFAG